MSATVSRFLAASGLIAILFSLAPAQTTAPVPPTLATQDSLAAPALDSASADSSVVRSKSRSDSVIVVKHRFHHREQIITGSVIMTCLALMLVAMNNYNPR